MKVNLFALDWKIWNPYCNLEIVGAIGLLVGLLYNAILLISLGVFGVSA
jgi:hypothetical protein